MTENLHDEHNNKHQELHDNNEQMAINHYNEFEQLKKDNAQRH